MYFLYLWDCSKIFGWGGALWKIVSLEIRVWLDILLIIVVNFDFFLKFAFWCYSFVLFFYSDLSIFSEENILWNLVVWKGEKGEMIFY